MRILGLIFGLYLTTLAMPVAAQPPGDLGWSVVSNRRGASTDFPGGLFPRQLAANANKMSFVTADGRSRFELFSIPNSGGDTPAQFARRADSGRERLHYKRITGKFIAASTIRDGLILYRRCNFSRNMIHCIDVRYPAEQERAWDGIVTRISLSLRPR